MPNVKRPLKFKLDAYRLFQSGTYGAVAAFAGAAKLNNTTLSGCMKDYASSYMSDDVKNFLRKKIAAGDEETLTYFKKHNLALDF
jgi:hypothetical protein